MRNLKKNKRKMFYALYSDKIPILDEEGNETLDYKSGYEMPVEFKASLSTGKSDAEYTPFGVNVQYDRTISTVDNTLPIDESTIIWIKNQPVYNEDGTVNGDSADYEVAALPLDGLNSLLIAIRKRSKAVQNIQVETSLSGGKNTEEIGNMEESDGF